jgi:hypothetical protein
MKTLVKFVKDNESGEIVAIFPKDYWTTFSNDTVTCYAHNGQHSCAHIDWIKEQLPANEEEYKPLLNELRSIGYTDLRILKNRKHLQSL